MPDRPPAGSKGIGGTCHVNWMHRYPAGVFNLGLLIGWNAGLLLPVVLTALGM